MLQGIFQPIAVRNGGTEGQICVQHGSDDPAILCITPIHLQAIGAPSQAAVPRLSPLACTLCNIVLPLQARPLHLVPGLGWLSFRLLGTPSFVKHMWQVGCVHLSELLIVA
jgi:hypothetical protein